MVGMVRVVALVALGGLVGVGGLAGCMSRQIVITSDPPGATVTLNDVEVGRTPVEADFEFYGVYDVKLEKSGYEPLRTTADVSAPLYEVPPLDLPANATGARTVRKFHYVLQPALEDALPQAQFEGELVGRARELGQKVESGKPEAKPNAKPTATQPGTKTKK